MFNTKTLDLWLDAKKTNSHHRQLLIVELPSLEISLIVSNISARYGEVTAMITEYSTFKCKVNIPISRYQDYLGSETDALIFDATSGIQLNALYAGAGMVSAGGIVIIVLNPSKLSDSNKNRFKFSYGFGVSQSNFIQLLKKRVQKFNGCIINQTTSTLPNAEDEISSYNNCNHERDVNKTEAVSIYNNIHTASKKPKYIELSSVQFQIAEDILSYIESNQDSSKSISVILGARGRGKSTLLGVIAAKLKQLNKAPLQEIELGITALHKNQIRAVNKAFSQHMQPLSAKSPADAILKAKNNDNALSFYSPDEIILAAPRNAIVLIDEIASIAPDLLKNIIRHFSHVVITGTTSGYEGSGNGFMQRVLPYLQSLKATHIHELKQPFRWLENDPIEACFASILSTGKDLSIDNNLTPLTKMNASVSYSVVNKSELIENSDLYEQLFSLLTQAHYQTTPNDIVRTLDANECQIFIAQIDTLANKELTPSIIGVAVVFEEGGDRLASIAGDISIGKRRVQGHLTAQALSLQLFSPEACTNTYFRVNRIAVLGQYCRNGIASQLLAYCEQYAKRTNFDYMSVSFGYTQGLYYFWLQNQYLLAKVGQRVDTASGTASVLMIKPISDNCNFNKNAVDYRIEMDLEYFSIVNQRLAKIFDGLERKNCLDGKATATHEEFLALSLTLYQHNKINFKKFSPALLQIIKQSSTNITVDKQTSLYDIFLHLHQKGLHKHEKEKLETKLISELNNS